jgi:ornithine cyclodeaminase
VNTVGSSVKTDREIDGAAVARSALFVDRRESTVNEAGDFILAKAEGAVTDDHIRGEIGDVLTGRIPGRRSPDEITLFKSLGLAIEDVAAADHIFRRAEAQGAGVPFDFGGRREP